MKRLLLLITLIFLGPIAFAQHQIGHTQFDFVDPSRGNRVIQTEIYYPSATTGEDVSIETGEYPVIVFGHGFVMSWDAYENIWEELVPRGYIMAFPRTEGNALSTDHQEFGWDLQYLVTEVQTLNTDNSSPLFGGIAPETALMGHSMGGGAAFLAADSLTLNGNTNFKTLIGLAPAESSTNGVSSINSALSITSKSLIFSGQQDGVTPPVDHQIPMYDNLASDCKTFINVLGGAHCYFANSNTACDFGEGTSSNGISITREEQHQVLFDFVNPWLDFMLKGACDEFSVLQDSLAVSTRVTHNQSCSYVPLVGSVSSTNVSCNGLSDGSATVIANGGTPSYSENWGLANPNTLGAGTYPVTITDSEGCSVTESVTISEPTEVSILSNSNNVSCNGLSDGTVHLTISGGTPNYTENWGSENPTSLSAGTYPVIVTDNIGCSKTENITITEPTAVVISNVSSTDENCGQNNGTASFSVSGGTSGYTEDWNGEDPNALSAGSYSVIASDVNGCQASTTIVIGSVSGPTVTSSTTNVNCNGGSDGNASLTISGGTAGYTENWNGEDPNALSAGMYNYTVEDAAGCEVSASVTITEPTTLQATVSTVMENCDQGNGTASVSISGGTPGYTENWNGEDPNALSSGSYSVTISDDNGCPIVKNYTVGETNPPVVSATSEDASCFGFNDGTATLSITGGVAGYTENWNGENPNSLSAGTYNYTVVDAVGCVVSASLTITEPTELSTNISVTDAACGQSNGTATLSVSGGTPGYTEDWGGANPNNLPQGNYTVNVLDNNGCMAADQAIIQDIGSPQITSSTSDISCFGFSDGTASISVTGGTPGYIENWNGADQNNLASGTYSVSVTDDAGCVANEIIVISQPDLIEITSTISNVSCFGLNDGNASIVISGGTPGYSEDWNGADQNNLLAGTYSINVIDDNGCALIDVITISEPNQLSGTITTQDEQLGNDGEMQITPSGGTAPYVFVVDGGTPQTNGDFYNLSNGNYTIQIVDANGCIFDDTFTILGSTGLTYNEIEIFNIYPNPTNDVITLSGNSHEEMTITLYNEVGKLLHNQKLFIQNTHQINLNNFEAGTYLLNIKCGAKLERKTFVKL